MVAVLLADGFEELEAITIIDILRRANISVKSVSVSGDNLVVGAHDISVKSDMSIDKLNVSDFEMIVLPGGLKNAQTLATDPKTQEILKEFNAHNKKLGAICAAPLALDSAGVLKDSFTCYTGMQGEIKSSSYNATDNVVKDQNIITSKGPATAMEFALEVAKVLGVDIHPLKQQLLVC